MHNPIMRRSELTPDIRQSSRLSYQAIEAESALRSIVRRIVREPFGQEDALRHKRDTELYSRLGKRRWLSKPCSLVAANHNNIKQAR